MNDLYLTLHVIGAVAWVGASTLFHITGRRVVAANDQQSLRQFFRDGEYFSTRYFIPVALLTVAMGVALVLSDKYLEFSDPFVSMGLTMFIVSFVMGAGFLGPQTGKLLKRLDAGEFETPAVQSQVKRVLTVSSIELLLLWATVVVMVVKPG
ncbi:MAG: hypothetical protein HZB14_06540 [Actinobacteria bacterium]|nr:hypothetical protein [Actinomycetota bacterium]